MRWIRVLPKPGQGHRLSLRGRGLRGDVQQVDSIERMQPITRVANVPDFVQGVINLREVVTPVIDLRSKFGMPQKEHDDFDPHCSSTRKTYKWARLSTPPTTLWTFPPASGRTAIWVRRSRRPLFGRVRKAGRPLARVVEFGSRVVQRRRTRNTKRLRVPTKCQLSLQMTNWTCCGKQLTSEREMPLPPCPNCSV